MDALNHSKKHDLNYSASAEENYVGQKKEKKHKAKDSRSQQQKSEAPSSLPAEQNCDSSAAKTQGEGCRPQMFHLLLGVAWKHEVESLCYGLPKVIEW